jgi:carbamoyl-phosphate synthase large subunit
MKPMNLLVSSVGRRVELLKCFRESADQLGLDLQIIASDLQPTLSSASRIADKIIESPSASKPDFISVLKRYSQALMIDLVVPTIDTELTVLSASREAFGACDIIVSEPIALRVARSKLLTAKVLSDSDISVPPTVAASNLVGGPCSLSFPIIAKVDDGSRSVGLFEIRSVEQLMGLKSDLTGYCLQTKIIGREFTCNCYVDKIGRLIAAVPHERLEVRAGEVSKARTERIPEAHSVALKIVKALPGLRGPFCFQFILDEHGVPWVFEINARFGGGYPLTHKAGAPFTKWILQERLNQPLEVQNDWVSGLTMLRYDAAFFVSPDER